MNQGIFCYQNNLYMNVDKELLTAETPILNLPNIVNFH